MECGFDFSVLINRMADSNEIVGEAYLKIHQIHLVRFILKHAIEKCKSNLDVFSTVIHLARSVLKMCIPESTCCTWVPVYFWSCVVIHQH